METEKYRKISTNLFKLLDSFIGDLNDDEDKIFELKDELKERIDICDRILWNIDTQRGEDEEYSDDEIEF